MTVNVYDLLSNMRDLVDEYDKYIDNAKVVLGRVSRGSSEGLSVFLKNTGLLLGRTLKLIDTYKSIINNAEIDELSVKYLKTYYSYLLLVSIPYIRDLLGEIKEKLEAGNKHEVARRVRIVMDKAEGILRNN